MNPISSTSRFSPPPPERLAPNNLQREGQLTVNGKFTCFADPAVTRRLGKSLVEAVGLDEAEALLSQLNESSAIIADLYERAGQPFIKVHERSSMLGTDLLIKKYDSLIADLAGRIITEITKIPN